MAQLILISLPIGNLSDITERSRQILTEKRHFLAEDTRNFKKILSLLELPVEEYVVDSFHEHSREKIERLVEKMNLGDDLCLVSDAGSPVISDPAYPLIQAVLAAGHELDSRPGVSSVLVALELSGLPPHPFTFHGFSPRDKGPLKKFLEQTGSKGTHMFFESPNRVKKTLDVLAEVHPGANVAVARELTKKFQEVLRFRSDEWKKVQKKLTEKGEFVVIFHLQEDASENISKLVGMAEEVLLKPNLKNMSKLLGQIMGKKSGEIYEQMIKNRN